MDEENKNFNSNSNNDKTIENVETSVSKDEEKTDVKRKDGNIEKSVFNIRYTRILIFIVGGAIVIIISLLIFLLIYRKNDVDVAANYSGSTQDDFLIYPSPEENGVIEYDITSNLSVFVKVTKLEKVKGVGTKAYYSIYTVKGKDEITGQYVWLENDGCLKLHYSSIGDNFVFIDYSSNGYLLDFLDVDGNLTVFDNLDNYGGLYIKSYDVNDNSIVLYVSRKDSDNSIFYGDDNNSIYICDINERTVDNNMTISATYTYSLVNDKLNLDNPNIDNVETFKTYFENNRSVYCQ